jgi:hypothetical protein
MSVHPYTERSAHVVQGKRAEVEDLKLVERAGLARVRNLRSMIATWAQIVNDLSELKRLLNVETWM